MRHVQSLHPGFRGSSQPGEGRAAVYLASLRLGFALAHRLEFRATGAGTRSARAPQHRAAVRGTPRPRLPGKPAHPVRVTARLRQGTAVPAPPAAPAAKKVASWILTPPGKLAADHRAALAQITSRCEELAAAGTLVRDFADMPCRRHGEHLETWASQAESSPISELRGFARGTPQRLPRRHRGTHPAVQLRRCGRPRQLHQDDQKADVWPGETRPAAQARPARRLTHHHN